LHHRGPDANGVHAERVWARAPAPFHHRSRNGQQPLYNEDGSVVVVFNGEIYNFRQLVPELTACGHVFRTHSDTEVIVHAWESGVQRALQRLRGIFAFALWDRKRETLFLARDRLGVKPLYYAQLASGIWLFGSELKPCSFIQRLRAV